MYFDVIQMISRSPLHEEAQQPTVSSFVKYLRLNADNSHKKTVCLFWGILTLALLTVFITSNYTPETFTYKTNHSELQNTQHTDCNNPVDFNNEGMLSCQDFTFEHPKLGLIMRNLSPMNQFAQINLLYLPKDAITSQSPLTARQTFKVQLMSLQKKQIIINQNQNKIFFAKGEEVRTIEQFNFDSNQYTPSIITLPDGKQRLGYEISLGYYRQFRSENALLVLTFLDLHQQELNRYDILPEAVLMNPNYTIFMLIFRGVFLLILSTTLVTFICRHRHMLLEFEQKAVLVLSGFSILFNDPYYFIYVFNPSLLLLFLSTTFLAAFLVALIISWICLLQKIVESSKAVLYRPSWKQKMGYGCIAVCYFSLLLAFQLQITYYSYTQSPMIPHHSFFNLLYLASLLLSLLLFLYIGWLYLSIIREWSTVLWRDKTYVTFNAFFILLNLLFISLGWFSIYEQSSQKYQIFYASMNLYVIYLQYMYSTPRSYKEKVSDFKVEQIPSDEFVKEEQGSGFVTIDLDDSDKNFEGFISKQI